eukprot:TRINITY_DN3472_c0_g1_i1.p1 TRINITY_DN3472_c0_g1~~TRINITY_DN3472_c0_g1_i1.p1  ORF type:complete len:566 (-),score=136.08 TRINITY_DN3472_c0_g1_i1:243-1940(-)
MVSPTVDSVASNSFILVAVTALAGGIVTVLLFRFFNKGPEKGKLAAGKPGNVVKSQSKRASKASPGVKSKSSQDATSSSQAQEAPLPNSNAPHAASKNSQMANVATAPVAVQQSTADQDETEASLTDAKVAKKKKKKKTKDDDQEEDKTALERSLEQVVVPNDLSDDWVEVKKKVVADDVDESVQKRVKRMQYLRKKKVLISKEIQSVEETLGARGVDSCRVLEKRQQLMADLERVNASLQKLSQDGDTKNDHEHEEVEEEEEDPDSFKNESWHEGGWYEEHAWQPGQQSYDREYSNGHGNGRSDYHDWKGSWRDGWQDDWYDEWKSEWDSSSRYGEHGWQSNAWADDDWHQQSSWGAASQWWYAPKGKAKGKGKGKHKGKSKGKSWGKGQDKGYGGYFDDDEHAKAGGKAQRWRTVEQEEAEAPWLAEAAAAEEAHEEALANGWQRVRVGAGAFGEGYGKGKGKDKDWWGKSKGKWKGKGKGKGKEKAGAPESEEPGLDSVPQPSFSDWMEERKAALRAENEPAAPAPAQEAPEVEDNTPAISRRSLSYSLRNWGDEDSDQDET